MREVEEPFRAGQKGSSAMPHKRNPITTERICGLARVLRGYAQTGLENVALWHERDISHSGAERVVLPDATILLDYMQHLALRVVRGMVVHADRMRGEPRAHQRRAVLPARAARTGRAGMQRDDAYRIVQRLAQQAWDTRHAAARRCSSGSRASTSISTPCSITGTTFATCPKCCAGWRRTMTDVLIYGAPGDSPDLFHAIPTPIIDPFLYIEDDGPPRRDGHGARRRTR